MNIISINLSMSTKQQRFHIFFSSIRDAIVTLGTRLKREYVPYDLNDD